MSLPANFETLMSTAQETGLYQKLIAQLNKDMLYANIELELDAEVLPSSLKLALQDTIYTLINERFADYLNLLYIIDVSEQKIKQLDGSDALKLSEQVTFLVLLREWQKVWYRQQYS